MRLTPLNRITVGLLSILAILIITGSPVYAQWVIKSEDGKTQIKIGVLGQIQFESIDTPDDSDQSQNLFFRRFRVLASGRITDRLTFFFETDTPNYGKGGADGTKNFGDVFIQDMFFTYKFDQAFQIDAGMMFIPISHHALQSAASLLAIDYAPVAFIHGGPTQSRVGRDWGVQARGYFANNHIGYRVGIFQGNRGENATAEFRFAGRLTWYPLDSETGFFTHGTYLGKKKIVALSASFDHQDDYNAFGADFYLDYPVGESGVATLQVDWVTYDGGETFPALPEQNTWFVEGGYYLKTAKVGVFGQYSRQDFDDDFLVDSEKFFFGLSYYPHGRNLNLKAGIGWISFSDDRPNRTQFLVQLQAFLF